MSKNRLLILSDRDFFAPFKILTNENYYQSKIGKFILTKGGKDVW